MENAIVFEHPNDRIIASTDDKLFKKVDGEWVEINNDLYKSEKKYPTTEGVDGDYFVKYLRKYNHLLYSEDFTQNVWNKDSVMVTQEPSISFPKNICSKLTATKSLSKHSMSYVFTNDLGKYHTFSIYVKPNELHRLQISLADYTNSYGFKANANFDDKTIATKSFGDVSFVSLYGANIDETVITYADKTTFNYFRIWLTVKFDKALRLSANITMLDNNGNEAFEPNDTADGLFINSAQLSLNTVPEEYTICNGTFSKSLYLEHLYQKVNGKWSIINNKLHYLTTLDINNGFGDNGDIATKSPIIKLEPVLLCGNGSSVSVFQRPVGTIRYSTLYKKWYVQGRPQMEYSLEYTLPKPSYIKASMAIALNQQVYQTYGRYCYPKIDHRKGICNNGGCYNDWNRVHIKR